LHDKFFNLFSIRSTKIFALQGRDATTDLQKCRFYGRQTPARGLVLVRIGPRGAKLFSAPYDSNREIAVSRHTPSGLRDPTGQSGDFIGHELGARARYWGVPDNLRLELVASAFVYGEFPKTSPADQMTTGRYSVMATSR